MKSRKNIDYSLFSTKYHDQEPDDIQALVSDGDRHDYHYSLPAETDKADFVSWVNAVFDTDTFNADGSIYFNDECLK